MAARKGGQAEKRWRALIRERERSGLGVGEFARRRGVSAATLYWWRSRLLRRVSRERATKLVAVEVVGAGDGDAPDVDRGFEVELAGGRRLRVPSRFDADALSRLIVAVERTC